METSMWGGATTRQQLQQSITLLQVLNEVPELPKENRPVSERDNTRCLSISRENEIASNLAFLSATSDNHQRVMAVCVEENRTGSGITIRVASNMGDLSAVTNGFKMLAETLEQAARRENLKLEDVKAVLRNVVDLDLPRILSRLRSRHAKRTRKTRGKPPLIAQLDEATQATAVNAKPGLKKSDKTRVQVLKVLFNRLEGIADIGSREMEVQTIIGEIVKEAYEFTLETDLTAAIENLALEPSLKMHLPLAIGKLGRYYSAASELVCAARDRKCSLFKSIQVEPFQIRIPPSIEEISPESQLSTSPPHAIRHLPQSDTDQVTSRLQRQMAEVKGLRKIHAEIQLLFYYELYPDSPRPRVICSSKSACYLCNIFFHIHGSFHVPRTHGRVYDKWILPDWLDIPAERRRELSKITTQFKEVIDDKIREAVTFKQKKYLHPNESVMLPAAHWTSSAISGIVTPTSPSSTSTIRPRSSLIEQGNKGTKLPSCEKSPPTPPQTPQEPSSDVKVMRSSQEDTKETSASKLAYHSADSSAVSATVSIITVRSSELPYNQMITLTTPSLHLQIGKLSITLDFVQVLSGRLSIARAEEAAVGGKGLRIVDIKDIPTATELQLDCPLASKEVAVQLQSGQKGIICIAFVWNDTG